MIIQDSMTYAYDWTNHNLLLVECPSKIEIQLQYTPIKCTPESSPMPILPRVPYDPESDILIWWTGREDDELCIFVARDSLQTINWGF